MISEQFLIGAALHNLADRYEASGVYMHTARVDDILAAASVVMAGPTAGPWPTDVQRTAIVENGVGLREWGGVAVAGIVDGLCGEVDHVGDDADAACRAVVHPA